MDVEAIILVTAALGGLGAFVVGIVLLVLYFRSGRETYDDEPFVYPGLIQCPACGHMNPAETAACLRCRRPLPRAPGYAPPAPPYAVPPAPHYGYPATSPPPAAPRAYAPPVPPVIQATAPAARGSTVEAPPSAPPASPPPRSPDAPPDMPHAWLEGTAGAYAGQRAVLAQLDTMIGRSTSCDIQVYDPKVSRRHFRIRYANGAFFLQDQQSSRGTRVNKQAVMAQRLKDGDLIEIGDSAMIFHVQPKPE